MTVHTSTLAHFHDDPPPSDVLTGLRSPGLLARWPVIGITMFIFGSLVFGALTYNLFAQGPLLVWDKALANMLPAIALKSPAFVKFLMIAGFYIGKDVITGIDLLLALYLLYKKFWQEFAMVTIGWGGYVLLFNLFSRLIGRPRPPTQIWIIVNLPGFPSGHAICAVVCYGLLGYLLAAKMPSVFWKGIVVAASLLVIGFIGFSRMFTGGHYLTDILAGYAVGIAWFGAAYTLIEIWFKKRRMQNVKKE